jgi:hypothetical protein
MVLFREPAKCLECDTDVAANRLNTKRNAMRTVSHVNIPESERLQSNCGEKLKIEAPCLFVYRLPLRLKPGNG